MPPMSPPSSISPASVDRALLPYVWALLASKVVFLAGIPLAVVILIASGVFRLALPSSAFMVVITFAFLGLTAGEIIRMRLLFLTGRWRALSGEMVLRKERPDRFRRMIALHGAVLLAYASAVVLGVWIVARGH